MIKFIILCFINSIRLKDIFKDKTNFLITFNEIDYKEINYYSLFEYNKLSIDFLINFIEKTTTKYIEESFIESKNIFVETFINKMKKYEELNNIKFTEYIVEIPETKNQNFYFQGIVFVKIGIK